VDIKFGISGAKEIDAALYGMPAQLTHKVLQAAHYDASKVLVEKEKNTAPEGPTGHLIDSIGVVKPSFSKANELGLVEVGPRRGRYKGNAAHLVEFGTVQRENKKGANRGTMPATPFAEPAWQQTKNAVINAINEKIGIHLWRFMKRTIKRNG
jgi:HK97 gp10 family phage protein